MDAVVFDLDGTLIDSAPQIAEAANEMLRARDAEALTLTEARSFIGRGADVFLARCFEARGLARDPQAKPDFMAAYARSAARPPRFYDGALKTLQTLRAEGLKLGLCTNKPRGPTDMTVAAGGLSGLFEVEIAGGEFGLKPEPGPLLACAERLGAASDGCVLVGDSEADAGAAAAANWPFALHLGGYLKAAPDKIGAAFEFSAFDALTAWLLSRR